MTFETRPCVRCDGSGQYSWNSTDGSRCYGCSGRGRVLTADGLAAKEAWNAVARPPVNVDDVVVGDRLRWKDLTNKWCVQPVVSIGPDVCIVAASHTRIVVQFESGCSWSVPPGTMMQRAASDESAAAADLAVADMIGVVAS